MTALVICESIAILVLAVLVAGLLRSHAEILRRLHELGAGYGEERGPAPRSAPLGPHRGTDRPSPDIVGRSPDGGAINVGVGRPGEHTLLLFLSSGCTRCGRFWDPLKAGAHRALAGTRTVVVARDADEESPTRLVELGPPDVVIVQSSAAWDAYGVPGSPFAVVVGPGRRVTGQGTAQSWDQLVSLVAQADGDSGEAEADRALARAGIRPGDPSLYPDPR